MRILMRRFAKRAAEHGPTRGRTQSDPISSPDRLGPVKNLNVRLNSLRCAAALLNRGWLEFTFCSP